MALFMRHPINRPEPVNPKTVCSAGVTDALKFKPIHFLNPRFPRSGVKIHFLLQKYYYCDSNTYVFWGGKIVPTRHTFSVIKEIISSLDQLLTWYMFHQIFQPAHQKS